MTTRYAHIEPLTMRAAMAQLPALATPAMVKNEEAAVGARHASERRPAERSRPAKL